MGSQAVRCPIVSDALRPLMTDRRVRRRPLFNKRDLCKPFTHTRFSVVSVNPWLKECVIDRKSDRDYHGVGNDAVLNLRIRLQSILLRHSSSGPSKEPVYVRVLKSKLVFWPVRMEEDI